MTMFPPRLKNDVTQSDGLRKNFAAVQAFLVSTADAINGLDLSSTTVPWTNVTGTPTTLAGYGIASPLPVAQGGTAGSTTLGARTSLGTPLVTVSETEPTSKTPGDIWHIPSTHTTYIHDGTNWYTMTGIIKP